MQIIDHGDHDPIEWVLTDTDQTIARIAREAIHQQRDARNERELEREFTFGDVA
jgi:hypothetical protein